MLKTTNILALEQIFKQFTSRKVLIRYIYIFLMIAFLGALSTSCKTKEGCEINESAHVKMNKKGKKKGKTKSNLFPKKVRKKL